MRARDLMGYVQRAHLQAWLVCVQSPALLEQVVRGIEGVEEEKSPPKDINIYNVTYDALEH